MLFDPNHGESEAIALLWADKFKFLQAPGRILVRRACANCDTSEGAVRVTPKTGLELPVL